MEHPAPTLALPKFFEDLLSAVIAYTPVDIHQEVRRRKAAASPMDGPP
ncbi:MAG TPA: hypothetical protein VII03_00795 [Solirubrobacteraceae bacterium]